MNCVRPKNSISLRVVKKCWKALVAVLHERPSAEVEQIRAETAKKYAEVHRTDAEANLLDAQAMKERVVAYGKVCEIAEELGCSPEKIRRMMTSRGDELTEAVNEIDRLEKSRRIKLPGS